MVSLLPASPRNLGRPQCNRSQYQALKPDECLYYCTQRGQAQGARCEVEGGWSLDGQVLMTQKHMVSERLLGSTNTYGVLERNRFFLSPRRFLSFLAVDGPVFHAALHRTSLFNAFDIFPERCKSVVRLRLWHLTRGPAPHHRAEPSTIMDTQ